MHLSRYPFFSYNELIAEETQQATYAAGLMAMVDGEAFGFWRATTDGASAILPPELRFVLLFC